jgi:cell shape-determining protein MreD
MYAENLGLVLDYGVQIVLALMLAATTIVFLVANLFIRNRYKTALLLGILSIIFSLSGHLYDLAFATLPLDSWTEIVFIISGVILYALLKWVSAQLCERISATANLIRKQD